MRSWDVTLAAMDERAAEHQADAYQATLPVWGGLVYPLSQKIRDAAFDYLDECREARRAAVDAFTVEWTTR